MNIRVGKTPYLNALPFYSGLSRAEKPFQLDFIEGSPRVLNELLRKGRIHVSLVSSLEYPKAPGDYLVFPDLSISAREASQSVTLIWKGDIPSLNGREIYFSKDSASSVALLDILLKERFEIKANLSPVEDAGQEKILAQGGPLLVIGDRALILRHKLANSDIRSYDLGTFWWEWMERPFCFALWLVRKEFYKANAELVKQLASDIRNQVKQNLFEIDRLLASFVPLNGISDPGYVKNYLLAFDYGLNPEILEGLYLFYERAHKLGWIGRVKDMEFIP